MSISLNKFLLILLVLGIGVQTFISCTLKFPEELESTSSSSVVGVDSSSSSENLGNSSAEGSSSSFEDLSSNDSGSNGSSSSNNELSSSSGTSQLSSSNTPSSSSSGVSSSSSKVSSSSSKTTSSSSLSLSSNSCTAKNNTAEQYCSGGTMKKYGSVTYEGQIYNTVEIGTQTWMAANLNFTPSSGKHRCYAQGNGNGGDTWLAPDKPADQPKIKANCDKYGRLYDWETAMGLSNCNNGSCLNKIQKTHKGICPNGWHLPDTSEWTKLRRFIEKEIFDNYEDVDFGWDVGTKLKAFNEWKRGSDTTWKKASDSTTWGVDSYGFAAIGSGYCVSCGELSSAAGYFSGELEEAHWWSATEYTDLPNAPTPHGTKAYKSKVTHNKKVLTQEIDKKADYLYSVRCVKN